MAGRVEQCDVVSGIAQANAGMNIGQLLQGEVKEAATAARKLFGVQASKKVVVTAVDIPEEVSAEAVGRHIASDKMLSHVDSHIYGTAIRVLFDSGAIPNVMSTELYEKLHLTPKTTNRRVTVADVKEAVVLGELFGVPITVGKITKEVTFLLVKRSPFDLIVGRPSMKAIRALLDFDHDTATFREGDRAVRRPFWSEGLDELVVVSNELTFDEVGEGWEETDDDSEDLAGSEELMLCLKEGEQDIFGYTEEEAVSQALSHLEYSQQKSMRKALFSGGSIVPWHLDELRPSSVQYSRSLELVHESPIWLLANRMPAKHNKSVREDIDRVLQARLIKPTRSPWGFPVVIATKKTESRDSAWTIEP